METHETDTTETHALVVVQGISDCVAKGEVKAAIHRYLPSLNSYIEASAAGIGVLCYYAKKHEVWKEEQFESFEDWCRAKINRAPTTVFELIANYSYFCLAHGMSIREFVERSVQFGWTNLRILRLKELSQEQLGRGLAWMENERPSREELSAKIDSVVGKQKEKDPDEPEVINEAPWKNWKVRLPPGEYENWVTVVEDAKARTNSTNPVEALKLVMGRYWQAA